VQNLPCRFLEILVFVGDCFYLSGHLPGVATPVRVKHLCGRWVNRTSVLEETHPMMFHSLQLPLETVHRISLYCIFIQTVPSTDESFCEEMSSHIQICPVLSQLELMASEMLVG